VKGETAMSGSAALVFLTTIIAVGQPHTSAFDVGSIRLSPPGEGGRDWGPQSIEATPGGLAIRNMRLADTIRWAYNVQPYQVVAPSWTNDVRFDISAKAASAAPESELRLMLQSLLADRFKLALHQEIRELPVLLLTVNKNGHKLQQTTTEGTPSFKTGKMNLTGAGASISQLTEFLSREVRTPVVDRTGLTGKYNFFLDIGSFVTDEIRRNMPRDGPPLEAPGIISQAMQEQLGLKLNSSKAPITVLVIDQVEKVPTEN
jgi:uncharacterized protein (TIGR03435 family)